MNLPEEGSPTKKKDTCGERDKNIKLKVETIRIDKNCLKSYF